jgi:hypothetical protein
MSELPPPDLMDHGARLRRIVLSLLVGAAVAAGAYFLMTALIPAEEFDKPHVYVNRNIGASGFVMYFTPVAGVVAFALTLSILNWRSKVKERRERIPPARQL